MGEVNYDDYCWKTPSEMTDAELDHAIERYDVIWQWCERNYFTKAQSVAAQTLHTYKKEEHLRRISKRLQQRIEELCT